MTRQHIPEDVYKSMIIRDNLIIEAHFEGKNGRASKPYFWVTVPEADTKRGCVILKNFKESEFEIAPHPVQQQFSRELQAHLQREHHHDGMWIVGWTHPPEFADLIRIDGDNVWSRMIVCYLDSDADWQFSIDFERPVAEMIEDGVAYFGDQASNAFETWRTEYSAKKMKDDMGLKDNQMTKATLSSLH